MKQSAWLACRCAFTVTEPLFRLAHQQRALAAPIDRPIFIMGPERSGTTFIYALLAAHTDAYALTTVADRFPNHPFSASLLRKILSPEQSRQYRSVPKSIGRIEGGRFSLTEGLRYWNRYLQTPTGSWNQRPDEFFTEEDVDETTRRTLPADLKKRLYTLKKSRLVLKQPGFSLKIRYFDALFPDAIFVHCIRKPVDNYRSLLGLKKKTGQTGWGIRIPERLKLPNASLEVQTAQQLAVTYDLVRDSISRIKNGPDRYVPAFYDLFETDFAGETAKLFRRCGLSAPSEILNCPELFVLSKTTDPVQEPTTQNGQALEILEKLQQRMNNDFPEFSFDKRNANAVK
ncbi:MAG TPA: sulfotransferase [Verrucomicrobiae bacterium]